MHCDALALKDFYAGPLGAYAAARIGGKLASWWENAAGQVILGLGFATPFLAPFEKQAQLLMAGMPAEQGAIHWPKGTRGRVFMCGDGALPLPDCSIDRILMVHSLEHAEHPRQLLREAWRILAGGGRLVLVVPSRTGIWARSDRTPFGFGSPFTAGQIGDLLQDSMFVQDRLERILFMPPFHGRLAMRSAALWEKVGCLHPLAGALMVEARKQIYAPSAETETARQNRLRLIPAGR